MTINLTKLIRAYLANEPSDCDRIQLDRGLDRISDYRWIDGAWDQYFYAV